MNFLEIFFACSILLIIAPISLNADKTARHQDDQMYTTMTKPTDGYELEELIEQIKQHENLHLQSTNLDEIIEQLKDKLAQRKQKAPQSDLYNTKRALKMMLTGTKQSANGLLIIGWIGGKLLVSLGEKLLYATGESVWWLLKQAPHLLASPESSDAGTDESVS